MAEIPVGIAGVAGAAAVTFSKVAVELVEGTSVAALTFTEEPIPFSAFTPKYKEAVPAGTFLNFTVITFEVLSQTSSTRVAPATTVTEGALYTSFLFNVADYTNVTVDGTQTYFAVLTDGVAANFKARLFIKKSGTQYQLGLTSGTTTTNYTSTLFNVGDTVLVVLGYDFAGNSLKAWFNPTIATLTSTTTPDLLDTPTASIVTLGGFLLRQDSLTTTPTITLDELRISTTIGGLLTSNQVSAISGLKVYPNPVSNGTMFIESDANAEKTVTVFDVLGKQVLNTTTSTNAINVSQLNTGVYMVRITEEGKTATKKLVIR